MCFQKSKQSIFLNKENYITSEHRRNWVYKEKKLHNLYNQMAKPKTQIFESKLKPPRNIYF